MGGLAKSCRDPSWVEGAAQTHPLFPAGWEGGLADPHVGEGRGGLSLLCTSLDAFCSALPCGDPHPGTTTSAAWAQVSLGLGGAAV